MSALFMCDNCAEIFSVLAKGWTAYTREVSRYDSYNHGAETMHMCPKCNSGQMANLTPKLPELPPVGQVG